MQKVHVPAPISFNNVIKKRITVTPRERLEAKQKRIDELGNKPNARAKYPLKKHPWRKSKKSKQKQDERIIRGLLKNSKVSSNKKCTVYVVMMWDKREKFIKVGLTTTTLDIRFSRIPYKWKEIATVEVLPSVVYTYEQSILKMMKRHKYRPCKKFGGYTECFKMDSKNEILALIS